MLGTSTLCRAIRSLVPLLHIRPLRVPGPIAHYANSNCVRREICRVIASDVTIRRAFFCRNAPWAHDEMQMQERQQLRLKSLSTY
jgi:hypothetical protein